MTIIDGILQGLIQGLTEFLPISSSGHLSLYQHFTNNHGEGAFSFTLVLHLGTLLAVCIVFYRDIIELIKEFFLSVRDIFGRKFSYKNASPYRRMLVMLIITVVMLGFALPLKDTIEGFAEDSDILIEGVCFLITSALLFFGAAAAASGKNKKTAAEATLFDAVKVGFAQMLAMLPGVSRSGSTTSTGLMCGFDREFAVKFSFLMGIPAILGGVLLDVFDMAKSGYTFELLPTAVGFVVALISGILSIKLLQFILKKDKLKVFAFYTLAVGVISIAVGIYEHIA